MSFNNKGEGITILKSSISITVFYAIGKWACFLSFGELDGRINITFRDWLVQDKLTSQLYSGVN